MTSDERARAGRIMQMSRRNAIDTLLSFANAQEEFEAAWRNVNYTQFELPALDVNKVLSERYSVSPSIRLTARWSGIWR
jgi:hypothetical protein